MTDKQRADHVQAKYWNGFITRTESQKVFDEQLQVIQSLSLTLQKMDCVVSFLAERAGVTPADVNEWVTAQIAKAAAAQVAARPDGPVADPSKVLIEA